MYFKNVLSRVVLARSGTTRPKCGRSGLIAVPNRMIASSTPLFHLTNNLYDMIFVGSRNRTSTVCELHELPRIYEILSNSSFSYALHRKYRKIRIEFIKMAFVIEIISFCTALYAEY